MGTEPRPLTGAQAQTLDAYWRAANHLSAGAAVRTLVIAAREDIEIARQTRAALAAE